MLRFLPIQPNLHDFQPRQLVPNLVTLAQLVVRLPGRQQGRGIEPVLMRYIFSGNYPDA